MPGESNLGPNPGDPNAAPLKAKQKFQNYLLVDAFDSYIGGLNCGLTSPKKANTAEATIQVAD